MILRNEGININVEGITHNLKGSIVTLSSDNLSVHTNSGFSICFSSGHICRNCMVPHINIHEIKTESQCNLRTKTSHDYHVNSVLIDPTLMPVYGVKKECPFSILNYLHPIDSMPQDILYDILEELMSVNFSVVIKGLVKNKFLTVLSGNKYISGKAVERWSLFYHIQLYIGKVVPNENEYWMLHLLCRKICQIILSPVIDIEWIPVPTHLIARHHELLAQLNPKSFTPKILFRVHYPRMIAQFGPLRLLWCLRFEAKHQYFKQIAHRVKNFRNITKTLAERHQMAKCALLSPANEWIQSSPVIIGLQQFLPYSIFPTSLCIKIKQMYRIEISSNQKNIVSVNRLQCNGTLSRVKTFVVYNVIDEEYVPLFAEIEYILYLHGLWVICCILHYSSAYNPHLDGYITEKSDEWIVYTPGAINNHIIFAQLHG
ncbi:uncharacterized protein LOC136090070 [Hydra vulgaris]|uniref:Uncharacterized protein LOC136090070 n=1 Tax=Hydra vulgaris TaxID=6087 RepID=A0ABM4DCZ4_HYDVU